MHRIRLHRSLISLKFLKNSHRANRLIERTLIRTRLRFPDLSVKNIAGRKLGIFIIKRTNSRLPETPSACSATAILYAQKTHQFAQFDTVWSNTNRIMLKASCVKREKTSY